MTPPFKKDLTGLAFNSWTVLAFAGKKGAHIYWRARCACGLEKDVESYHLTRGRSKACRPCSAAVVGTQVHLTHGRSKSKLYRAWQSMKTRCYNVKAWKSYRYHGALGIRVADQWLNDFEAFAAHIGEPPSPHHTVDRIDPFRGYEPGNVRWATQQEQMQNTRRHAAARGVQTPAGRCWERRKPPEISSASWVHMLSTNPRCLGCACASRVLLDSANLA